MLDGDILKIVEQDVEESFEVEEIKNIKDFETFFSEVDVQHGYEEDWKPKTYKPYYLEVFKKLKGE